LFINECWYCFSSLLGYRCYSIGALDSKLPIFDLLSFWSIIPIGLISESFLLDKVKGMTSASKAKGVVHAKEIGPASRSFAEFLVHDFVGCWVGDEREEALAIHGDNHA
jgi:hypothetical protein